MTLEQRWHELCVYLLNRPVEYCFSRWTRFLGRVLYVPGSGYFVNDAEVARNLLTDTKHFSQSNVGGMGDLVDRLFDIGVPALFNMKGAEHGKLKTLLREVFAGDTMPRVVAEVLGPELDGLTRRLADGEVQDLAAFARRAAALLTTHLIGLRSDLPDFERLLECIAEAGRAISARITVRSMRLSPRQVRLARADYARLDELIREPVTERESATGFGAGQAPRCGHWRHPGLRPGVVAPHRRHRDPVRRPAPYHRHAHRQRVLAAAGSCSGPGRGGRGRGHATERSIALHPPQRR